MNRLHCRETTSGELVCPMTPKLLATDHATASKSDAADASTTVRAADVAREPHRANLKGLGEKTIPCVTMRHG